MAFAKAGKSPRLIFILYLANLFTALLLALPFKDFLERSFENSKLPQNLLEGFDITVFSNLVYYNSSGLFALLGSLKWFILAYFLLSIFLSGGIIRVLNRDKFSNSAFFSGATFNFFRFLGLSILFIFVQILFLAAVYVPVGFLIASLKQKLVTECILMSQRIAMIHEMDSPDYSDKHLIANFIETLIHIDYLREFDTEQIQYNEVFHRTDKRIRLLLPKQMRANILQMIGENNSNLH